MCCMTYSIYVVRTAARNYLQKNRNLWLTKRSKSWKNLSSVTCLFRNFRSDKMEESSQRLSVFVDSVFCFVKYVLDISFMVHLVQTNHIMHLAPIKQLINLYSGEISPTRYNNCVFYSQWLYSTCFG